MLRSSQTLLKRFGDASLSCDRRSRRVHSGSKSFRKACRAYQNSSKTRPDRLRTLRNAFKTLRAGILEAQILKSYLFEECIARNHFVWLPNHVEASSGRVSEVWRTVKGPAGGSRAAQKDFKTLADVPKRF